MLWERRDARITNWADGAVAFEQTDVEFPAGWSLNATNIVAQKYFRGTVGAPERESSLRQVIDRVVDTITRWGIEGGYFADDAEASAFSDELKYILVTQRAAFNSPVWFNIGVDGVPQQASACYILEVDDTMDSILEWYRQEGLIFKGGSGAGTNLSRIRSSAELLKGGGTASGPVSFMRGADASAGTIKSGGKTRRAAKMVILNADHPDIEEFVWCKAIEERKTRVLRDAGFDMDLDGKDSFSVQYQNANNSVRVTDEFMQAVIADADWDLRAVKTGEALRTVKARDLWREIAQAAWECADPGLQFDTTINRWHTLANTGPIEASNPCSEFLSASITAACNLASINLLPYLDDDRFDVDAFKHTVELVFTAQEILVGRADYPTEKLTQNSYDFRQLGLGYTNIGAMLMALGLPYDSVAGRAWAAAITSLMTGHAYATSARTAARVGPFAGFAENEEHMLRVLRMHRDAAHHIEGVDAVPPYVVRATHEAWESAVRDGEEYGVRNSQATVLAPTGTISFMMDADTTGIEPDLSLVKTKKLVGGGTMSIVNQTVPRALAHLGYDEAQIAEIVAYIDHEKSVIGAPHLSADHLPVFACSMGDNPIHYEGHVRMLAAVQPFISGAVSQDDEHARVGDRRRGRAHAPAGVGARPQVDRDLPRQLQGRPAAVDHEEGVGRRLPAGGQVTLFDGEVADRRDPGRRAHRREGRPPADPPEAAAQPPRAHVRVPGRRLQGLPHRRRVRRRPARRGVPHRVEAGLDAGRDHGRVRQVDLVRPAVRRAAAGVRRGVHEHALRAGGHDRRPGDPLRVVGDGLPVPQAGDGVPLVRRAGRAVDLLGERTVAADSARHGGGDRRDDVGHGDGHRPQVGSRRRRARRPDARRVDRRDARRQHPGRRRRARRRRADVHAVRRHDGARRLVPRLPELRQHQRLQLTARIGVTGNDRCESFRVTSMGDGYSAKGQASCTPASRPGSLNHSMPNADGEHVVGHLEHLAGVADLAGVARQRVPLAAEVAR